MTVHIRVRDDADGYYAAHRGEVIGTLDSRAEAEEVCRVALNGDEWEVVGGETTTAEVPATTVDAVAGPSDGRAGLLLPATSGGITCMTCGAALVPGGPVCCPRPRRTT